MALDNHPRPPREDQWRPVRVLLPAERPDLAEAIYLRRGKSEEMELYSGLAKRSKPTPMLLMFWFAETWERASVAAHRKTIADRKAAAPVDSRW